MAEQTAWRQKSLRERLTDVSLDCQKLSHDLDTQITFVTVDGQQILDILDRLAEIVTEVANKIPGGLD